ncbi:MAG: hypothetical protein ABI347_01960 [Nitrososphaera sp.]
MGKNLKEIEKSAGEYARLKQERDNGTIDVKARLDRIAAGIIEELSQPEFAFPLRDEVQVSKGTTTFVYEGGAAYPKLYEFLSEILHVTVPIVVNDVKFGPGEIIVEAADGAASRLQAAVRELQQLVRAKSKS